MTRPWFHTPGSRFLAAPLVLLSIALGILILEAGSISAPHAVQQGCQAVTFYSEREAQLIGDGQYTILVRQSDNSYTGIQGQTGPLFPHIGTIPNFQNTLAPCESHPPGGAGTPAPPAVSAGAASQAFAIGDLTGKGDLGAVLANGPDYVTVYQGASGLVFQSLQTYHTGNGAASVRIADLNGDAKPDLVVVNTQGGDANAGNVSILLGNGDGTFQPAVSYLAGAAPTTAAVGDFNADGKLDVAVSNSGGADVSILLGNGDGTFQAALSATAVQAPSSVMAADFNLDGKLDLAVANGGANLLSILLGNGDGTFQPPLNYPVGSDPVYVAAGDLNGDGKLDLAVANYFGNSVSTLLGNGDGTFQVAKTFVTLASPTSLVLTDFDADGHLDVVVGLGTPDYLLPDLTSGVLAVLLGNGDGTLHAASNFPTGSGTKSIATADFNGDGKPDLVTANPSSTSLSVLLSLGNGHFQSAASIDLSPFGQSGPVSVVAGDFDGDLKPDIAVVSQFSASVAVLIGNGDGTFKSPVTYLVGTAPSFVLAADFNGDGALDLAVVDTGLSTSTAPSNVILLFNSNDGLGTFQAPVPYAVGVHPGWAVAADFDGDGKIDLAVANGIYTDDVGGVSVLLGAGTGVFHPAVTYLAGAGPAYTVRAGDFNGDGNLDLVATVGKSGAPNDVVAILLSNGDGTFHTPITFPTATNPIGLALADLNGDSRLDLILAHCCGNTDMTYLIGNGDGTFQTEVHFAGGPSPSAVVVSDFNANAVPDLAIADQAGSVTILLNVTPPPPQLSNVSAASFQGGALAPESIVSAFGSQLSVRTDAAQTLPLPTTLGGATVTVKDAASASRSAPLFYASPGQVNYEIPAGTAPGTATITIANTAGNRVNANVQIAPVAPGLFYFPGTDTLAAAGVLRVRQGVAIPENDYQIDPATSALLPLPIDLGTSTDQVYVILYGTGIRFRSGLDNVRVQIGGVTESVLYAGPQPVFAGLDQVNALIPRSLAGSGKVNLTLTVDGLQTNTVTLVVK